MGKINLFLLFTAVLSAVLFSNCRLNPIDDIKTDIDQEWALPIIDTEKSFGDIINGFDPKAFLQIGTDSTVILRYKGNFIAQSSLDIFANFRNVAFPVTDSIMSVPFSLPSGVYIDYVNVKKGTLRWGLAPPTEPLNVTIYIPQLTKNGVPFSRNFNHTSITLDTLEMAGWQLAAKNDSIFIHTIARKISNGQPVNLKNGAVYQIQNFEFAFAKGYFGQSVFDGPQDSIKIDFFDKWKNGSVRFDNPRMIVTLDNSFGVPVRSIMRQGEVVTLNGQRLTLQSPLTAGIDINYPSINEIGKTKRTVVVFDKTNSNIAEIMSSNPVGIQYDIDGLTNPDNNTGITGFMTDSSKFELQVEVEVPMIGKAQNFEVNDTFDINLAQATDVTQAEFKVVTDNGMPIDLSLQGYFATANGTVIDSMYTAKSPILRGASVNSSGLPINVVTTENFIKIDADKLKKIKYATKLIIRYAFSTTSSAAVPVRLTSTQKVRVRIGVKFGLKTQ
ncbi:MAG: hypothetical protein JNL70_01425 [Saprospiraceae bacterium]|nr:hypothetical protein [Saprospiraceae bacterium]